MRTYKAKDMLKVTGANRNLYNQWVFKDIIRPAIEADGPGRPAHFSFGNLVSMSVILKLRRVGVRLKPSAKIAELVRELVDKDEGETLLSIMIDAENPDDPYRIVAIYEDRPEEKKKSNWPISLVINLNLLRNEIKAKLE